MFIFTQNNFILIKSKSLKTLFFSLSRHYFTQKLNEVKKIITISFAAEIRLNVLYLHVVRIQQIRKSKSFLKFIIKIKQNYKSKQLRLYFHAKINY